MTPFELAVRLVAGVLLILANGFFVAIEFALTRARQYSREEFLEPGLELAWEMTQDLEIYLTTCQVGITASSIALGVVAEPAVVALVDPLLGPFRLAGIGAGALVAFLLINLVHLTHGEQTPTYLGVERSRTVCRYGARPLHAFNRLIYPVIRVGDTVAKATLRPFGVEMTGAWLETGEDVIESRAELRHRLGEVLEEGGLPDERREEVLAALDVGERTVRDEMVPAEDVIALRVDADPHENLRTLERHPQTRYPLVDGGLENLQGIVYTPILVAHRNRLARGQVGFEDLAAPPLTFDANLTLSDAIDRFQAEHQELALVTEGDDVVGLLTVTDALEAVMGDVEDPLDRAEVDGDEPPDSPTTGDGNAHP